MSVGNSVICSYRKISFKASRRLKSASHVKLSIIYGRGAFECRESFRKIYIRGYHGKICDWRSKIYSKMVGFRKFFGIKSILGLGSEPRTCGFGILLSYPLGHEKKLKPYKRVLNYTYNQWNLSIQPAQKINEKSRQQSSLFTRIQKSIPGGNSYKGCQFWGPDSTREVS